MRPEIAAPGARSAAAGWQAELALRFAERAGRTVLSSRRQCGPLTVQRAFYPEGSTAHVYLLHPPGGVVGGDELHIEAHCETGSHALLTTPAAGKFYRSSGLEARQRVQLKVDNGAGLEWLPQETIVYEGARLVSVTQIELAEQARFIGWEITVLGRPAADEGFDEGCAELNWRIQRAGRLFYLERQLLNAKAFQARWGLAGHSACGTMFIHPAGPVHLAKIQALISDEPNRGVTLIEDLLICRALDHRADLLKVFFERVWGLVREEVLGKEVCLPRVWAT